jgi:hypothetical protein
MINLGLNITQNPQVQIVSNLFTESADLTDAFWKIDDLDSIVKVGTDVFGNTNSYLITSDSTNNTHGMEVKNNYSLTSGITYTCSIFVKANTISKFQFNFDSDRFNTAFGVRYDLTTPSFSEENSDNVNDNPAFIEADAQNCGNGWVKVWCTFIPDNTSSQGTWFWMVNDSWSPLFTGDGTESLYLCYPQINEGYLKKYTKTT